MELNCKDVNYFHQGVIKVSSCLLPWFNIRNVLHAAFIPGCLDHHLPHWQHPKPQRHTSVHTFPPHSDLKGVKFIVTVVLNKASGMKYSMVFDLLLNTSVSCIALHAKRKRKGGNGGKDNYEFRAMEIKWVPCRRYGHFPIFICKENTQNHNAHFTEF